MQMPSHSALFELSWRRGRPYSDACDSRHSLAYWVCSPSTPWQANCTTLTIRKAQMSAALPALAAVSLAVMRWHLHFSRMGIEPIMVPLAWAGTTWLLLRGWRTGSWWTFAGSGVILAGGMYAYQAAWVIPLLMVASYSTSFYTNVFTNGDPSPEGSRAAQHASRTRPEDAV